MQIQLKLLANYRTHLPQHAEDNTIPLTLPDNFLADGLFELYHLPPIPESVMLINGLTPKEEQLLQEGDVICIFPAMAGG
ncbi:MAG: hypothetical protein CVU39_23695 [Chloroflexi bacterium HGW-Chloroflexi-10]|nr:MAG: hypothetical protein CVU39_23695 [Chloroflexi bacterium HGW-Chloroflexi-10]